MSVKYIRIFLILFFVSIIIFTFSKIIKNEKKTEITEEKKEDVKVNSNIIKNVNYSSKDVEGNEYIINASEGEIDYSNTSVIFLTNVRALVKLKNSEVIIITSDYGKYNTINYDTIFSKNVEIEYLQNQINSEYLDFSIKRNTMIISKNVIYNSLENIMTADVIEIDIDTKDTKIFMHEDQKKVNIKSKNWYGNY